jgi:hypothetical protein
MRHLKTSSGAYMIVKKGQCALSETQPETMLSSMGFKPPHDLATDSNSFSISGAHLMNDRFQKLYLGFCKIHTNKSKW